MGVAPILVLCRSKLGACDRSAPRCASPARSQGWLPCASIGSHVYVLAAGSAAGIAFVGNDDMVGSALITSGKTLPNRRVVPSAGGVLHGGSPVHSAMPSQRCPG